MQDRTDGEIRGARHAKRQVVLLGPQRLAPTLRAAVESAGVDGPVAAVTAGWEEREPEDLELGEHLDRPVVNLRIYQRADEVYQRDPELHRAMRERHDRLRNLQELYRLRLTHALEAAHELLTRDDDPRLLEPEQDHAIEAVRRLDAQHLLRVAEIHSEFEAAWRPGERDAVAHQRQQIAQTLAGTAALCVAGGHVPILLNRMRLLDVTGLSGAQPIFAWSGGAMVMSERIVLFHDNPPQGAGNAEVLVPGLAACPGVIALPHASRRLQLADRTRVALLARRFAPSLCAALDDEARLDWDGDRWTAQPGTQQLTTTGAVEGIEAA